MNVKKVNKITINVKMNKMNKNSKMNENQTDINNLK